jgi:hypothetical protein
MLCRDILKECIMQFINYDFITIKHKSKFYNVYFDKSRKKWQVSIRTQNKRVFKQCLTEIDAALLYNELALKYHGEFALINEI